MPLSQCPTAGRPWTALLPMDTGGGEVPPRGGPVDASWPVPNSAAALTGATAHGHLEVEQHLCEEAQVDASVPVPNGEAPLYSAAAHGHGWWCSTSTRWPRPRPVGQLPWPHAPLYGGCQRPLPVSAVPLRGLPRGCGGRLPLWADGARGGGLPDASHGPVGVGAAHGLPD